MVRWGVRFFFIFLLLAVIGGGAVAWTLFSPYSAFSAPVFLDIPRGTSTQGMAKMLAENGVIRSEWQFLAVRAFKSKAVLQAGEYKFDHPDTPWNIYDRIARGDINFYELVVPEGSNTFDISTALEKIGLMKDGAFLKTVHNPQVTRTLLKDLAPGAPSLEGFLFPSTYRITKHTSPEHLAREMVQQFRKVWESLQAAGPVLDTVTLASLVEKESAVPSERPLVASVYANRLQAGMKLDCDPTTIYAAMLEGRWRGTIYRSDLDSKHPYNTYQNAGLPPGPIANPGRESLTAALHPATSSYLFFVAKPDGSGEHIFTAALAEHEQAVAQYRRGHKQAVPPDAPIGIHKEPKPSVHR